MSSRSCSPLRVLASSFYIVSYLEATTVEETLLPWHRVAEFFVFTACCFGVAITASDPQECLCRKRTIHRNTSWSVVCPRGRYENLVKALLFLC
jgi:hypothetical protein